MYLDKICKSRENSKEILLVLGVDLISMGLIFEIGVPKEIELDSNDDTWDENSLLGDNRILCESNGVFSYLMN